MWRLILLFAGLHQVGLSQNYNDFDLSEATVPIGEIYPGGPPRDGIRSIDNPRFVEANKVKFLHPDDLVIGLELEGITKAYPIKILDRHEIVNDKFNDQSLTITYCPLCNSGVAFRSPVLEGHPLSFGVSGLLYNSDVLMYDRQTESLWSQLLGKAISGRMAGEDLVIVPIQILSWKNWKSRQPKTKVLQPVVGYSYINRAYADYRDSDQLMFPVAPENNRLRNKEIVFGFTVHDEDIALSLSALKRANGKGRIQLSNGDILQYVFDSNSEWLTVLDGQLSIPVHRMYWFAWYAFHPQTKLDPN